jgi:lipid-binding SYLF domain-containing protein
MIRSHLFLKAAGGAVLATLFACAAIADEKEQLEVSASKTMSEFSSINVTHYELTQKAAGVLVFPHVTKGGAGAAAEYGEGVLMVGGRAVGFYKLTGGSAGASVAFPERSEVLLFMTPEALQHFIDASVWTIGVDADVAVAAKGAGGAYTSDSIRKPIIAFAFGEQGFIADVSLVGTKISRMPA